MSVHADVKDWLDDEAERRGLNRSQTFEQVVEEWQRHRIKPVRLEFGHLVRSAVGFWSKLALGLFLAAAGFFLTTVLQPAAGFVPLAVMFGYGALYAALCATALVGVALSTLAFMTPAGEGVLDQLTDRNGRLKPDG